MLNLIDLYPDHYFNVQSGGWSTVYTYEEPCYATQVTQPCVTVRLELPPLEGSTSGGTLRLAS